MDPITQAALGASLAESASPKRHFIAAAVCGALAGMAADLDVLIQSSIDPLLSMQYHRHFSHSLIFIPIGSLLCALLFHLFFKRYTQLSFKNTFLYCTLGYATHALLDACTSYGTLLLWPFSNTRFSWDTVSVVDPLVSLPLIFFVILAAAKRSRTFAVAGLVWVIGYQFIGLYQQQRVLAVGKELAQQRGHQPIRIEAKPSFGNIVLWKVIYEIDNGFFTDGIRAGKSITIYEGEQTAKLNIERDFPWLDASSQQAKDIERFRWFSQGYLAIDPSNPFAIIDARYSLLPNQAKGMWGIQLSPTANKLAHARTVMTRRLSAESWQTFVDMLFGKPIALLQ